jgi:sugar phosphate isomerase/epimerase
MQEEFDAYGSRITDIHLKDRLLGGGPVELGTGAVDFEKFYEILERINYRGIFIMQAFRDDEGLEIFKKQLGFIKRKFQKTA